MLVDDSTEVIHRVASITRTTIGKAEASSRIARIGGIGSISIRNRYSPIADSVERKKDVAATQVSGGGIDLHRIGLIEHIEEPSPELNLLGLSDVEVLKERDVEVASARSPNIERWLRWTSVGECRDSELTKIVNLTPQRRAPDRGISEIDRSDRANACTSISAVERIRTIPSDCLSCCRYVAGESQANRYSTLERRYTRQLPSI